MMTGEFSEKAKITLTSYSTYITSTRASNACCRLGQAHASWTTGNQAALHSTLLCCS